MGSREEFQLGLRLALHSQLGCRAESSGGLFEPGAYQLTELPQVTSRRLQYLLITAARNEAANIERTIESVIAQTVTPMKWVIVDDGSTDATADIVKRFLRTHDWIELFEMPRHRDRSFAAKARCFNAAYERVKSLSFDVIGNLDADISFDQDYLEFLMGKFEDDPALGVVGTIFKETGYSSDTHSFEGENHVAGGCQMFRRLAFENVGGYVPTKIGTDWIAVTSARMKGWKTRSFREKAFFHHRSLGSAGRTRLQTAFLYGEKDYRLGWHPLYELFRVAYQGGTHPLIGLSLGLGYTASLVRRTERPVSPELMRFHRGEQLAKLKVILKSLVTFRRIDSFQTMPR
jgi:glycosyltransferase involved in cell wall biosynthesis